MHSGLVAVQTDWFFFCVVHSQLVSAMIYWIGLKPDKVRYLRLHSCSEHWRNFPINKHCQTWERRFWTFSLLSLESCLFQQRINFRLKGKRWGSKLPLAGQENWYIPSTYIWTCWNYFLSAVKIVFAPICFESSRMVMFGTLATLTPVSQSTWVCFLSDIKWHQIYDPGDYNVCLVIRLLRASTVDGFPLS